MPSEACNERPPSGLVEGIEQFNRGEFYKCHDALEELWMAESGAVRHLYQGILQIGVAFYHLRAGRYQPVVSLLKRGSSYLEPFAPECMGVNVARLLLDAASCLAQVRALGPDGLREFDWESVPIIELREQKRDDR